jgi:hypothetical protein
MLTIVLLDAASPRSFSDTVFQNNVLDTNELLGAALQAGALFKMPCLAISGIIPPGINGDLLRQLFTEMRAVETHYAGATAMDALSDVLMREPCIIERLELSELGQYLAPDVFTVNTSLRTLRLLRPVSGRAELACLMNATAGRRIEWIYALGWDEGPMYLSRMLGLMPSLRVLAGSYTNSPTAIMNQWWPDAVAKQFKNSTGVIVRHAGVLPLEERRKLHALYECAGRVLPDHVIRDIADLLPHVLQ